MQEREKHFPQPKVFEELEEDVLIYWNDYQIPFIEAKTDLDAAFALGLVHSHLRLGQMELLKRVASGRLSESFGFITKDIDESLRVLDFKKGLSPARQSLPKETLNWLKSYVKGINYFIKQTPQQKLPHEFHALQFKKEVWTVEDVLSLGRLASSDLSWLIYIGVLSAESKAERDKAWQRVLNYRESFPSFKTSKLELGPLLYHLAKTGSNSVAISPQKAKDGSAYLANDPHLGIYAPNLWVIVGLKSPGYHLVGLMVPGIPIWGLGRNKDIAWGGTNARSLSSHLYRVPPTEKIKSEKIDIKSRFFSDRKTERRLSSKGPLISDIPFLADKELGDIALYWEGHQENDGMTAFLKANRAKNFSEFRSAFDSYAVGGQNLLYADNEGNIGQILAYRQPILQEPEKTLDLFKDWDNPVVSSKKSTELAFSYNPKKQYLASANNRPFDSKIPLSLSYSSDGRIKRIVEIMESKSKISLEDLKLLQQDIRSTPSYRVAQKLAQRFGPLANTYKAEWKTLKAWDGTYSVDSKGALVFETLGVEILRELLKQEYGKEALNFLFRSNNWKTAAITALDGASEKNDKSILRKAQRNAKQDLRKFKTWGEKHRLRFGHPLQFLPLVGDAYTLSQQAAPGSTDTLYALNHQRASGVSNVTYGANARHISKLSDVNENYFVLLGGQDGYLLNEAMDDQLGLWNSGNYIRVPLKIEAVKKNFNKTWKLSAS